MPESEESSDWTLDPRQWLGKLARNLGCGFVLMVVMVGLLYGYNFFWGEKEGSIKTADCRIQVAVKEGSPETWFKTFYCEYDKARNGVLLGGSCHAVEMSGGACVKDTSYDKKPKWTCPDPKRPLIGLDGLCHSAAELQPTNPYRTPR